jgi:hypothetical protein
MAQQAAEHSIAYSWEIGPCCVWLGRYLHYRFSLYLGLEGLAPDNGTGDCLSLLVQDFVLKKSCSGFYSKTKTCSGFSLHEVGV